MLAQLLQIALVMRNIWGSIPVHVKSNTMSPAANPRCVVSSELCCPGAKSLRWTRRSLHASVHYREYNEDLIFLIRPISKRLAFGLNMHACVDIAASLATINFVSLLMDILYAETLSLF